MHDVEDYSFLASAIAGMRLSVCLARHGEGLAYFDGSSVILLPIQARDTGNVWRAVVAQSVLVAAGSMSPACLRKLVGRRTALNRYVYLEVCRGTFEIQHRLPSSFFIQVTSGVKFDLRSGSPAESVRIALSNRPLPETPSFFGTIRPLALLRNAIIDRGASPAQSSKSGRGASFSSEPLDDDEEEGEESKLLKLFQNPISGNSALSKWLTELLGGASSKGENNSVMGAGDGIEIPVEGMVQSLRRGVHTFLGRLPIGVFEIDAPKTSHGYSYREWDAYGKCYKPRWTFVEEVDPWSLDGERDVTGLLHPPSRQLLSQLSKLGLDHQMNPRQVEGTDLDTRALIDCAIELASGYSPPTIDVYRASRRTRRNLAVSIALDISGSTGQETGEDVTIFDQQLTLCYQLGKTFSVLGDVVELFGFHSWGRNLVRSVRLKGRNESWSSLMTQRFANLEPIGYTRLGTAIRHGIHKLKVDIRLPHRLFILITDGIAYDQDYEMLYAEADARKALEEAAADGVACLCICINPGMELDRLHGVFGAANVIVADEAGQVASRIGQPSQRALALAARRMR